MASLCVPGRRQKPPLARPGERGIASAGNRSLKGNACSHPRQDEICLLTESVSTNRFFSVSQEEVPSSHANILGHCGSNLAGEEL